MVHKAISQPNQMCPDPCFHLTPLDFLILYDIHSVNTINSNNIKRNIFSHHTSVLNKGTDGPDGTTPVSVRHAFNKLIQEVTHNSNKEKPSA